MLGLPEVNDLVEIPISEKMHVMFLTQTNTFIFVKESKQQRCSFIDLRIIRMLQLTPTLAIHTRSVSLSVVTFQLFTA